MKVQELTIEGMTCGHCVMHMKKALSEMTDVRVDDVQIGRAKVTLDEAKVPREALMAAVEKAGYRLVSID
jgi:copper chaperone